MNSSEIYDNNTLNSAIQRKIRFQLISATAVVVTTFGMLCQGIAMVTLIQCRRLRPHIKYPTVGFLLSNIIGLFLVAVFRILIVWSGISDPTLDSSQIFISGTFLAVSRSAVAHMSVDRLWACAAPFTHRRIMTGTTIRRIIYIQWIIIPVLCLGSWSWDAFGPTDITYEGCSLFCYRNAHIVLFANILTFSIVGVIGCCGLVCYVYLISHGDTHASKNTTINSVMTKVIVLDLVLGLPFLGQFVIEITLPDESTALWNNITHINTFAASTLNSILTAFMFALRLPECKKNLYLMFAPCFSKCRIIAGELQAELDKRHGHASYRKSTTTNSTHSNSQQRYVDNTSGYGEGKRGITMVSGPNTSGQ